MRSSSAAILRATASSETGFVAVAEGLFSRDDEPAESGLLPAPPPAARRRAWSRSSNSDDLELHVSSAPALPPADSGVIERGGVDGARSCASRASCSSRFSRTRVSRIIAVSMSAFIKKLLSRVYYAREIVGNLKF
jgi:hypothetical protein